MALTHTPAPDFNSPCPDFSLPGTDGKIYSRKDFTPARALLVMFICNHCPYVKAIEDRLITLGKAYSKMDLQVVAINSNDTVKYPEDSFANMKIRAEEKHYPFPYLLDESQEIARTFGAVCTPDFFLYDQSAHLKYRGRLDDSWKDPTQVKTQELKAAIDAILSGQSPATQQTPSMGCNIKWKQ